MAHLHWRRPNRVWTKIRIPNPMTPLFHAEHVHITQTQTQIPTPYFSTGQESESKSRSRKCKWAITHGNDGDKHSKYDQPGAADAWIVVGILETLVVTEESSSEWLYVSPVQHKPWREYWKIHASIIIVLKDKSDTARTSNSGWSIKIQKGIHGTTTGTSHLEYWTMVRGGGWDWSGLLLIPGAVRASYMLEIEIEIGIQPITNWFYIRCPVPMIMECTYQLYSNFPHYLCRIQSVIKSVVYYAFKNIYIVKYPTDM